MARVSSLERLVGSWTTEATHPALEGVVVHGTADVSWLEGRRFLLVRSRTDHPQFPDALSVLGVTEHDRVDDGGNVDDDGPLTMHYFDSRGVFRVYRTEVDDAAWRIHRDAGEMSQRFVGTFADGGDTIVGRWQMQKNGRWTDDLQITYRRG
jgi:hypothetical protein